jgi:hypothetical protein
VYQVNTVYVEALRHVAYIRAGTDRAKSDRLRFCERLTRALQRNVCDDGSQLSASAETHQPHYGNGQMYHARLRLKSGKNVVGR